MLVYLYLCAQLCLEDFLLWSFLLMITINCYEIYHPQYSILKTLFHYTEFMYPVSRYRCITVEFTFSMKRIFIAWWRFLELPVNCSLTLDKTMSERNIETFLSVRHKRLRQHISSQKLNMKKRNLRNNVWLGKCFKTWKTETEESIFAENKS